MRSHTKNNEGFFERLEAEFEWNQEQQKAQRALEAAVESFPDLETRLTFDEAELLRQQLGELLVQGEIVDPDELASATEYARTYGSTIDNALLLQPGSYESQNGTVEFQQQALQEVQANWRSRLLESIALGGDDYEITQQRDPITGEYYSWGQSNIMRMLKGLDQILEMSRHDERYLPDLQRLFREFQNELTLTLLGMSGKEYIVFESSPFPHDLLKQTSKEFVGRRGYFPEQKIAMHRSHHIHGDERRTIQTAIENCSIELWDTVYGNAMPSDAARIGQLFIIEVGTSRIDHDEAHTMSLANIDQAHMGARGQLTVAGRVVESRAEQHRLYQTRQERMQELRDHVEQASDRLTEFSSQLAADILGQTISPHVRSLMEAAVHSHSASGKAVLPKQEQILVRQSLESGELTAEAAAAIQNMVLFELAVQSAPNAERLAQLIGRKGVESLQGKPWNAKTLREVAFDAYADGRRAGGCPGVGGGLEAIAEKVGGFLREATSDEHKLFGEFVFEGAQCLHCLADPTKVGVAGYCGSCATAVCLDDDPDSDDQSVSAQDFAEIFYEMFTNTADQSPNKDAVELLPAV